MSNRRIGEIGSGPLPIIATLREYQGTRFLELRLYKRSANPDRVEPTNWAVAITKGSFNELKCILDESDEEIQRWFGTHEISFEDKVRADMAAQVVANRDATRKTPPVELRFLSWSAPTFFEAKSEGGKLAIDLNKNNPIVSGLVAASERTVQILTVLLASYCRAKDRFLGQERALPAQLFKAFEYEWGVLLGQQKNTGS
jgi:hypothetical protein